MKNYINIFLLLVKLAILTTCLHLYLNETNEITFPDDTLPKCEGTGKNGYLVVIARKEKLTIKPVVTFNTDDIKQIRQRTGLSQVMFAGSLGVSPKTVEAWENGRNKPEGPSRRLLEIVRDDPGFIRRFQT